MRFAEPASARGERRWSLASGAAIAGTVVVGAIVGSITGVAEPHSWPRDLLLVGPLVAGAVLAAVLQQTLP
jgi:hypothetical protein